MRYDKVLKFVEEKEEYDPTLGESTSKEPHSEKVKANLTDASEKVMLVAFGEVRQGSKVARLLRGLSFSPTHAYCGDVKYKVCMKRLLKHKATYILEEVS
ncbi:hypothetical protein ACI1UN_02080 [Lactococcus petauri]|uniref:hypothetical protein n=1 Tax=Lactococcus petauri TaxID=1940789 RepID=UPI003852477D